MNIDDRAEMLGGRQQHAPAEIFAGVWGLAGSVLPSADYREHGVPPGTVLTQHSEVRRVCSGPVGISQSSNDGQLNLNRPP